MNHVFYSSDIVSVISLSLPFLFYNQVPFALPSLVLPFALKAVAPIVSHLNAIPSLSNFL